MARTDETPATSTAIAPRDQGSDIASQLTWAPRDDNRPAIPEAMIPALVQAFQNIPDEGGAGIESILQQLLTATDVDTLNAPWDATNGRALAGRTLSIRSIIRRPSQFEDGPQLFLVVDAVDAKTGENVTFTSSALAVLVQLAMAYNLGMFPIMAEVVVAERPTERGYYPYHLRVLAASGQRPAGQVA
jgi:hypothetical protein